MSESSDTSQQYNSNALQMDKGSFMDQPSKSTDKLVSSSPPSQKKLICFSVCVVLANLALALCFGLVVRGLTWQIHNASRMCDKDAFQYDTFKDPPDQVLSSFFYNLSNPSEWADGATAQYVEYGPWSYKQKIVRDNIKFHHDNDTIAYDIYYQIEHKESESCDGCSDPNELLWSPNLVYETFIRSANSEAMAMVGSTCSQAQIQNIANNALPFCTSADYGTANACRCCNPTTTTIANSFKCTQLASAPSFQGGLWSYLAESDRGLRLDSTTVSQFPLSSGAFTFTTRQSSPNQILLGFASVFLGTFHAGAAIKTSNSVNLQEDAQYTKDLKDACMPLYCPNFMDVSNDIAANPGSKFTIGKGVDCSGLIPAADELQKRTGMSKSRAQELAYLEGSDCKSFNPAFTVGALVNGTVGASITCALAGETEPCCPTSFFVANNFRGAAIGCIKYVPGLFQPKRFYSTEEANAFSSTYTEQYTGCAKHGNAQEQTIWKGETEYPGWYTPSSYAYGVTDMPWADISVSNSAVSNPSLVSSLDVYGGQLGMRKGRGLQPIFLNYFFTDGKPNTKTFDLWLPFRYRGQEFEHKKRIIDHGIEANKFIASINNPEGDDEAIEASQRDGQMPYWNLWNVMYSANNPVIMSFPNYAGSSGMMLSQDDNTGRTTSTDGGVELYRGMDGDYSHHDSMVSNPKLITKDTQNEFESTYFGFLNVEPATGLSLSGSVVNMFSTFTWNCNPAISPSQSCQLFPMVFNHTGKPMCYTNGVNEYGCSASNVFTPYVQGAKVHPIYWFQVRPNVDPAVFDLILAAMDARYAMMILIILGPCLSVILLSYLWYKHGQGKE